MKKLKYLGLISIFVLSGCVVRTYEVTRDRVDQDLTSGNRGYLQGEVAAEEAKPRKTTRTTRVVEIELFPSVKFEKTPKKKPVEKISLKREAVEETVEEIAEKTEDKELTGNQGFIIQSTAPEILEPEAGPAITSVVIQRYTVQKGDTLQKISKKFYGNTRKWTKIYEVNENILKGSDRIYPGQVLSIPLESTEEPIVIKPKIK